MRPFPSAPATTVSWSRRLLPVAAFVAATATAHAEGLPWERYQPIVDRAPFGAIYDPAAAEAEAAAAAAAVPETPPVPEGPALADTVKVSAITVFGGQPAAGFTDSAEGKSYYLYLGRSAGEFTLVDVLPDIKAIVLRKGSQEEKLYLNGAAPSSAVVPEAPAPEPVRTAPRKPEGRSPGYAELQRQRAEREEARALARQKAEEERQKRIAELEAMTAEERDRDLRDKNIDIIVSGNGPPLPIELNRQDLEILAEKGFDVTEAMQALEEKEAADAADPPNERIRRIRERRAEARRRRAEEQGAAATPPAP